MTTVAFGVLLGDPALGISGEDARFGSDHQRGQVDSLDDVAPIQQGVIPQQIGSGLTWHLEVLHGDRFELLLADARGEHPTNQFLVGVDGVGSSDCRDETLQGCSVGEKASVRDLVLVAPSGLAGDHRSLVDQDESIDSP